MSPGSVRIGSKSARTRSSLSAHPIFASRSFRRRTQLPRPTKNGRSISMPAHPRFGSATSMDPCPSFLGLIISYLVLFSVQAFPRPFLDPRRGAIIAMGPQARVRGIRAAPKSLDVFCSGFNGPRIISSGYEIHLGRIRAHQQPPPNQSGKRFHKRCPRLRLLRRNLPPHRRVQ